MALDPDPRIVGNLALVERCVAEIADRRGIGTDRMNELFEAGQLALAKYLDPADPTCRTLTRSVQYVRKAVKQAIEKHWQRDRTMYIPPSTRHRMVKRGKTPPDPVCGSFSAIFDRNGNLHQERASNGRLMPAAEKQPYADGGRWGRIDKVLQPDDGWGRIETILALEEVFACCRDDDDRDIVNARLDRDHDTATPIWQTLREGWTPVHMADVAARLGLRLSEVRRRLQDLEARYYKRQDRRMPTSKHKQQPRRMKEIKFRPRIKQRKIA